MTSNTITAAATSDDSIPWPEGRAKTHHLALNPQYQGEKGSLLCIACLTDKETNK